MPENAHDASSLQYWRERDRCHRAASCRFLVLWNAVVLVVASLAALASFIISFCFAPESLWFLFGVALCGLYIALHEIATRKATSDGPSSCRSSAGAAVLFLLLGDLPSMILALRAGSYSEIPPSPSEKAGGKPGPLREKDARGGQDIDALYEGAIIYGEIDTDEDLHEVEDALRTMRSLHGYKDADSHRDRYEGMIKDYRSRKKAR